MSQLTRCAVLPGLLLAAGLVMARNAAAQGGAATEGAATPAATKGDDSEESAAGPTKAAADAAQTVPVPAPPPRPPAEPNAAPSEDEIDAPSDHWETFSNGRIGSFVTYSKGEGMPQGTTYDPVTGLARHQVNGEAGGTGDAYTTTNVVKVFPAPADGSPATRILVSTIDSWRIRSGFTGNVVGLGVKRRLGDTKVTGYISVTSIVDSQSQKKYFQSTPDFREGYIKLEGKWGSVLMGRAATLFDRGAVETDFMYLHGYGAGFPGDLKSSGGFPTGGQIGFGVLANGYAAGLVYATPKLAGVQLSVGIFDPAAFIGTAYERTRYPRPEFELTVDEPIGSIAKVHVYFNGGYQKSYQNNLPDDLTERISGLGYGARVEVGPVHVGVGGHRGRGLGFAYPGLTSSAADDAVSTFRDTDGVFAMGQLVLGKFDLDGGYGKSIIHMTPNDLTGDPTNPSGDPKTSFVNSQAAVSGAVVFHAADWLHFDVDVMHADSEWDLGEHQRINFYNAGTTITW
jgi:Gram-negative porin